MMRKFKTNNLKTERGATSLYVVIFTTLLLGIITLSFVRIVISEASQTSNSDLSQSAYDSALAGVEDAKVALLKYHDCLSRGAFETDDYACQEIIYNMQNGINAESCDVVRDVLGRPTADDQDEVLVQETVGTQGNESSELQQAYTCVKISEELEDYRSTLGSDQNRVRMVPIRTDDLSQVRSVKISWYSEINAASRGYNLNYMNGGGDSKNPNLLSNNVNNSYAPPVLSVQFLQAAESFYLDEAYSSEDSTDHTNFAEAFLYPQSGSGTNTISRAQFTKTNDKVAYAYGDTSSPKQLFPVNCQGFGGGSEFACSVTIELPMPVDSSDFTRNEGATFLRIGLPYGEPVTDFSVELHSSDSGTLSGSSLLYFSGVQARVDSTGRANDLYRRIETRVELVDIYFPYPEFTIQAEGSGDDVIKKSFYVTQNCWYSSSGSSLASTCPNNDY